MFKYLLPLIAALKFKHEGQDGEGLGQGVVAAYKAAKEEVSRPDPMEGSAALSGR